MALGAFSDGALALGAFSDGAGLADLSDGALDGATSTGATDGTGVLSPDDLGATGAMSEAGLASVIPRLY